MSAYTNEVKTSELIAYWSRWSKDDSAANVIVGKQSIQHYYTFLMSQAKNYTLEKTRYGGLKADQRSYLCFPDYIKMKNVRVKSGDQYYPATEVKSIEDWHNRTIHSHTSNQPTHYIIMNESGNMYIELDPIPSADVALGLEQVYEGRHDPLSFPDDYTTGTLTAENGSQTITGSGTTFTSAMVGRFLKIDKWWYEILSVQNSTQLTLVNYFQEVDTSGASYEIAELMRLPAEYHWTPLWGALEDYWQLENAELANTYGKKYVRELVLLQRQYKSKSKGNRIAGTPVGSQRLLTPRNYPTSAIG